MRNSPQHFLSGLGERARLRWQHCTVIEGDARLILMTQENLTSEDFRLAAMPNLREITGSLLVFQVVGIESLNIMFPNLRIIRGNTLVANYALVLFQNPDLKEIGLSNLTEISKGGVRIAGSSELCYVDTIDWNALCREESAHILIEENKDTVLCSDDCEVPASQEDLCIVHEPDTANARRACWNREKCQLGCPKQCAELGLSCNTSVTPPFCCHPQCAAGCIGPKNTDCYACRNVRYNKECLEQCPPDMYKVMDRRCITFEECEARSPLVTNGEKLHYKAVKSTGECSVKCPPGYEEDPTNEKRCIRCKGVCPTKCHGGYIRSLAEASHFKGCNIVQGDLDVMIQSTLKENVVSKLESYLGEIREITHYLKVSFSPSLVSLNMFKKLRVIHGMELWNGTYAIAIFENSHLSKLWKLGSGEKRLRIENGKLLFHNNPRLCYSAIMELADLVNLRSEIHEYDVSPISNGNEAVCEELNITFKCGFVGRDTIVVELDRYNTTGMDQRMFLGYQLYYRPVESENISIFEDRDACHDSWQMQFVQPLVNGAMITNLMPYTLYAFYVKTLMVNSPGAKGGISEVLYVRTTFGPPSHVLLKEVESISDSSIFLQWEAPLIPNGEITHYMISYFPKTKIVSKDRNYCESPPDYSQNKENSTLQSLNSFDVVQPNYFPVSYSSSWADGYCSKYKCCACSDAVEQPSPNEEEMAASQKERAMFENSIQNIVFVSRVIRKKRSVREVRTVQPRLEITDVPIITEFKNVSTGNGHAGPVPVTVNVTGFNYTIENLRHFTSYEIRIWACQNISFPENFCSKHKVAVVKSTMAIDAKDAINESTIHVLLFNGSQTAEIQFVNSRSIRWEPPEDPNGAVVSYELDYAKDLDTAKKFKRECITHADFERNRGIDLIDLPPGNYSFRLRAMSLASRGPWTRYQSFIIVEPRRLSESTIILIAVSCSLLAIALGIFLVISIYRRKFQKKLQNAFSANPEYISQSEVYVADEWELRRDDIELLNEIGRGTFGKVYAGRGKNVKSVNGITFGNCAVKTVSESASVYDRWHFLIEASVMKKFNTAFIVKLYGVVSEGQPSLVVMEMMENGNLKDYLRSRRPDSEESPQSASPPTITEFYQWAAEIADGMAYLEAIKFCHRDLAARNCMVSAGGICKIGDFGMARDVYIKDYYRPQGGRRLMPVRWMAPEALKDAIFTSKSDIWSYGVVLWEITSLASHPYGGFSNEDVMRYVVDHRKVMSKPNDCPAKLYDIMLRCWQYEPKDRPLFADLIGILFEYIPSQYASISFYGRSDLKSKKSAYTELRTAPLAPAEAHAPCEDVKFLPLGSSKCDGENGSFDPSTEPVCKNNRVCLQKSCSSPSWMKISLSDRTGSALSLVANGNSGTALLNGDATFATDPL